MTQTKIYVGNLSYDTTEDGLRDFFSQFGEITDLKLIIDHQSGRSKGFGFITYSSDQEGLAAVEGGNGQDLDGRKINVNTARESTGGGAGGRSGGGGGGNRGGNRHYN